MATVPNGARRGRTVAGMVICIMIQRPAAISIRRNLKSYGQPANREEAKCRACTAAIVVLLYRRLPSRAVQEWFWRACGREISNCPHPVV